MSNDRDTALPDEEYLRIKRSRHDGYIFVIAEFLALVVYCFVDHNQLSFTDIPASVGITFVAGVIIVIISRMLQRSAILESEDRPIAAIFAAATALAVIVLSLHAIHPPTSFIVVTLIISGAGLLAELTGRIGTNIFEWAVDRVTAFYTPRPQPQIQAHSGPYRYSTGA